MHAAMHRPPRSRAVTDYTYRRTYKACIPCRERKAKCELLEESRPPCSRCKRMNLDCRFTEKRPWARENPDSDMPSVTRSRIARNGTQETQQNQSQEEIEDTYSHTNRNVVTALQHMLPSRNDPFDLFLQGDIPNPFPFTSLTPTDYSTNSEGCNFIDANVLRIWNACRFVRMGWIKAREAVVLVGLFFQNMFPLSPVLTDFYNTPENHYWLVTQEPMLCCTILMISSRYHVLPGLGGTSRAYSIHNRLWQHYQHLILRIMLGQEKLSKAKTRHVGSIEALLLMCEWYPRALNFPLENDGWDSHLILTEPDFRDPPPPADEIPMSDRWKEDVVEPTRRSDRMSWMLASTALALAHELGIFKNDTGKRKDEYDVTGMRSDAGVYLQQLEWRRRRLPSLLYVFANMLASRLGCTSLIPEMPIVNAAEGVTGCPCVDNEWMYFMASWVDLTRLAKDITDTHFPSKARTGDQTRNSGSSEDWDSMLYRWQASRPTLNSHLESILHIEYQYLQVFTNSIKVQALVEKILNSPTQSATTDRTCIDEVINRSSEILQWLLIQPSIQYLPIRVFLRIISSSIFLMKALALGVRTTQLHASLNLLEQTITTLQSSSLDDMQLVSQYASLLQIHVSRLRQTFTTSAQEREKDVQSEGQENTNTISLPGQADLVQGSHDPMLGQLGEGEGGDDWLWLPIDPLMAPFGTWDDSGQLDYGLNSAHLDLDFIWNLPP